VALQGLVRVGQHLHAQHAELGGSRAQLALPHGAERAPGRCGRSRICLRSPRMAEMIMTSAAALAARVIVPPAQKISSSGRYGEQPPR
jgi:hypothetical protein